MCQRRSDWPSDRARAGRSAPAGWCSLDRVLRSDRTYRSGPPPGMSRRGVFGLAGAVLAAAGLAGTAGCTDGSGKPAPSPSPDPLAPVLSGTEALIDLYAATSAAQPSLAARLDPLLAEHRAHAAALRTAMGLASASASASAEAPSPGTSGVTVPDDPAAALAAVVGAERAAQVAAVKDCLASRPEHAGLLGSIAASRACHLEVLG